MSARGIGKRFGATVANDDIDLELRAGEIHALLGENGAGKTTLLSILGGLYQPDSGELRVDGEAVRFHRPGDAIALGIGTVHQHFTLAPQLTVVENIALGLSRRFRLDLDRGRDRSRQVLRQLGLEERIDDRVAHLSLGERQRLEIAKALVRGSRVLLLDEPTSILSPGEVADLFSVLRELADDGAAIVLVTHKLDDAMAMSDRITVLRRGRVSGRLTRAELVAMSEADATTAVVSLMFESSLPESRARRPASIGAVRLTIERVSLRDERGVLAVQDCSLMLCAGEIVGLAGVDGNGQRELAEAIAGQRPVAAGVMRLDGESIERLGVAERRGLGIAYLTDDRLGEGSVSDLSVAENLALTGTGGGFWLDRRAMARDAVELITAFDIRTPGPERRAGELSGGNLQKLLLARELSRGPSVLIANKPTHGLDARTAALIRDRLRLEADTGRAVLLIESDLDDLLSVCDRIAVMARGRIAGEFAAESVDAAAIGRLMVGAA